MKRGTKVKFQPLVVLTQFDLYSIYCLLSLQKSNVTPQKKHNIKRHANYRACSQRFTTRTQTNTNTHTTYKNIAKTWGLTATENKQQAGSCCNSGKQ